MAGSPQPTDIGSQLQQLRAHLNALTGKAPNTLIVQDDETDITYLFVGPNDYYVDPDGRPITIMEINDYLNNQMFGMSPATVDGNVGTDWFWAWRDRLGNQVLATDGLSGAGLAVPYHNIAMYPYWNGGYTGTPSTSGYATVIASQIASQKAMFEGRIGFVSHPAISVDGLWGRAAGSGAEVITYTVAIDGVAIGSWTAGGSLVAQAHFFDLSAYVGQLDLSVQLLAQSSVSNSDPIACHIFGVHLRQTPAVFG
jgi:hypothetical protein